MDFLDRIHRVGVQNDLHGSRSMEVDPVRNLLRPGVAPGINPMQVLEVSSQRFRIRRIPCQCGVVHNTDSRRIGDDASIQDALPRAVIDALDT